MGAWGYESCSNDNCWDYLDCEDIHEPTQEECDRITAKFCDHRIHEWEEVLGCTIWFLDHGLTVSREALMEAFKMCDELINDDSHIEEWSDPEARVEALNDELDILVTALKGDGKGEIREVEGLLEKIAKGIS